MTCTFLDGPALGHVLMLRRAPVFLRVVIDPAGKVDALDQFDDEPRPSEQVHVYRREGHASVLYACRGGSRSGSGRYEYGEYRLVPDAPADDLRDTDTWRAWATAQGADDPAQ